MISEIKQAYFDKFGIDMEKASKKALVKNENGTITAATEMCGDIYIKKEHLFDVIFPDNIGYKKETRKKFQKAGVDYIVYLPDNEEVYVDIKVCVGPDYSMQPDDYNKLYRDSYKENTKGIPLEIYQNDIFTYSKGKLTDYVLFIIMDKDGIVYNNIQYETIRNIALAHKKNLDTRGGDATWINKGKMTWHTSNNGSGIYIKWPIVTN
jgi:hypothetical protein